MSMLLASSRGGFFNLPVSVEINDTTSPLTATLSFNLDGSYTGTVNGRWYLPPGVTIGNDFEILAEEVGGPTGFSGTFGVWLPLSSPQTWSLQQVGVGLKAGQINFSLRRVSGSSFLTELCDWSVEVLA